MNRIILLIAFSVCTAFISAQSLTDVLYLKDSTIVKGIILEQIPNQSLKIQLSDGTITEYATSDIEKILKEAQAQVNDNAITKKKAKSKVRSRGYQGYLSEGASQSLNDVHASLYSISTSHGVQINPNIFLGVGMAVYYIEKFESVYGNKSLVFSVPTYLNFRCNLLRKNVSPYIDIRVGAESLAFQADPITNILYFSPSIGLSIYRFNLGFSLEYINHLDLLPTLGSLRLGFEW